MVGIRGSSQPSKLVLVSPGLLEANLLQDPIVDLPIVVELEGAEGVRDVLEGVRKAVGEIVEGVNTPLVSPAIMGGVADPIENGVTHDHVGMGHVDLGSQHVLPVTEFAGPHLLEQLQVLVHGTSAERTVSSRLSDGASELPDLLLAEGIDVRLALPNQDYRALIEPVEIVGSEIEVIPPIVPQPPNVLLNGSDVLHVFCEGIGVVEPEMTDTAVLRGQPEVQNDGLGVTDMEIPVGFRGKSGLHSAPIGAVLLMLGHNGPNEVGSFRAAATGAITGHGCSFFQKYPKG
jgi:hypothetical protein